jgi:hypothetical protein
LMCGALLRIMGGVDGVDERREMMNRIKLNMDLVQLSPRTPGSWHWDESGLTDTHLPSETLHENVGSHIGGLIESFDPERSGWTKDGLLAGTRFEGGIMDKRFDPLAFADQNGMK